METLVVGLIALVLAAVSVRVIAMASKIVLVVGLALVLVGVWTYPTQAYMIAHKIERGAVNLVRGHI
jgi:hypothetical membrane protein